MRRLLMLTALTALMAAPALAETQFTAVLNGGAAGTTSPAMGSATLVLNDDLDEVTYTIEYSGLLGTETAAHFHNAGPAETGPVVEPLPATNPKTGTWMIEPDEVVELLAERIYINIHTDMFPAGEIRGNVTFDVVPTEEQSLSEVKSDFR